MARGIDPQVPHYRGLQVVGGIMRIIGVVVWIGGLVGGILFVSFAPTPVNIGAQGLAVYVLSVFLAGLLYYALGEGIGAFRHLVINSWHMRHSQTLGRP